MKWIPVSEKLPNPNVPVLICCRDLNYTSRVSVAFRLPAYNATTAEWMCGTTRTQLPQMTAWMPLPKPYPLHSRPQAAMMCRVGR